MSLSDDLNLRLESATMDDVADLADLFSEEISWTPTFSVTAPMTISSTAIQVAKYYPIGDLIICFLKFTATIGGTSRYEVRATAPVTPIASTYHPLTCNIGQPNSGSYNKGLCYTDSGNLVFRKYDSSELTASTIDINCMGIIRQDS